MSSYFYLLFFLENGKNVSCIANTTPLHMYISMGLILRSSPTTPRSLTGSSKLPHSQQRKGAVAPSCEDDIKFVDGFLRIAVMDNYVVISKFLRSRSVSFCSGFCAQHEFLGYYFVFSLVISSEIVTFRV